MKSQGISFQTKSGHPVYKNRPFWQGMQHRSFLVSSYYDIAKKEVSA